MLGIDDMSTGLFFTLTMRKQMSCSLFKGDILDLDNLTDLMDGVDVVYHMAAKADIRGENENPRCDLEQNTVGTFTVAEAMRLSVSAKRICLA